MAGNAQPGTGLFAFDEDGARRVVSSTLYVERMNRNALGPRARKPLLSHTRFRNDSDSTIPAYGVVKITGMFLNEPGFTVDQSSTYGAQYLHALNTERAIGADKYGAIADQWPALAKYDLATDGRPTVGEQWGPVSGSWLLRKYVGGFLVVGVPAEADTNREDLVWVLPQPMLTLTGKTAASHAKGAFGTITIWHGATADDLEETTYTISAYNRFANVSTTKWVDCEWTGVDWKVTAAEC